MGAPVGNKNAVKDRIWRRALLTTLADYEDTSDPANIVTRGEALATIARKVVRMALAGDIDCIHEIGNRLDGKPVQAVDVSGELGNYESRPIEREHRNSDSLAGAIRSATNSDPTRQH